MQFTITFRHLDPSDTLRDYAYEKIKKVQKFLQGVIDATVVLSKDRYLHISDITITAGNKVYKGKEESEDMYNSIDRSIERIEKQIKKSKGRYIASKRSEERPKEAIGLDNFLLFEEESPHEGGQLIGEEKIFRKQLDNFKPNSIEDAVSEMRANQSLFMVFINSETNKINVLYKRKDGNFGLIET